MKLHPAYLWVGSDAELTQRALDFIKEHICKKGGCNVCADCKNISNKQHHLLLWLSPENYYTLAQLEVVMQTIVFALDPDQHFFIVFEHAELFNTACANSLLKSLEEPPAGYHFILLARRTEGILPTIRSRCMVEIFPSALEDEKHPLLAFFTPVHLTKAAEFTRELERNRMPEKEVPAFLDYLVEYWLKRIQSASERNDEKEVIDAQAVLSILEGARAVPLMPGSSKIFLRNLYLMLSIAF